MQSANLSYTWVIFVYLRLEELFCVDVGCIYLFDPKLLSAISVSSQILVNKSNQALPLLCIRKWGVEVDDCGLLL